MLHRTNIQTGYFLAVCPQCNLGLVGRPDDKMSGFMLLQCPHCQYIASLDVRPMLDESRARSQAEGATGYGHG